MIRAKYRLIIDSIAFADGHTTLNVYDADGRKLRTVHIVIYDEVVTPGGETITPSDTLVRDYSGSHIYENGVLERTLTPTGYYSSADSQYCYYIKDYQGNNIAVVKADANGAPEVVSATLMYPFGGELTEMSATDRYRFGGKEFDTRGGLFHYDFGARHYDPVFPQFTTVDPMAEDNVHLSPLAYCHGNPVMFIDPTGEDEYFIGPTGIITKTNKTEEFDRIILVDAEGNTRKGANGEDLSIQYEYNTLKVKQNLSFNSGKDHYGYDVISVNGDKKGSEIFEFLSNNITTDYNVEIGQVKTGGKDSGKNYIITNHEIGVSVGGEFYKRYLSNTTARELIHSHPLSDYAGNEDKYSAYYVTQIAKQHGKILPRFFIYHTPTKTYIKYKPQKTK